MILLKLGSPWAPSQLSPSCKPLLFPLCSPEAGGHKTCPQDRAKPPARRYTKRCTAFPKPCQQGKPCPGADNYCYTWSCDSSPAGRTYSAQKSLETKRRGRGAGGRHLSVKASMSTATKSSSDLPQWMSFKKTPMTSVVGEFRTPGIIASPGALIIRVATRN